MFFPYHDNNPTHRFPAVTVGLVAVNVLVWLWVWNLPPQRQAELFYQRGFVPARVLALPRGEAIDVQLPPLADGPSDGAGLEPRHLLGAGAADVVTVRLEPVVHQVLLSLVTCMFLHAGWAHVLGNMWFLWLFGNNVEDRLGSGLFAIFYLAGGLVATGCHWLTGPSAVEPTVGASGAVAGVLGAYAVSWPRARIRTLLFFGLVMVVELPALGVLGFWFVQQLLEAVNTINLDRNYGVAWWAHIGGFVFGAALMPLARLAVPPPQEKPEEARPAERWDERRREF